MLPTGRSQLTELSSVQMRQEPADPGRPHLKHCGPGTHCCVQPGYPWSSVWTGLASDLSLAGMGAHPGPHAVHAGPLDPIAARVHSYCHCTPSPLSYQDHPLLSSRVAGPPNLSHYSSVSVPWFTADPLLCRVAPEDSQSPVGGICGPQAMDHEPFHLTQAMPCNVHGGGEAVQVTNCEPEPRLFNLDSPQHQVPEQSDGVDQFTGVLEPDDPSQLPQYHQADCSLLGSRDQTDSFQSPPAEVLGTWCDPKSKKGCHCTRSQCLKRYCECFANGLMCHNCDCTNCYNNTEHETKRQKAIKVCLHRNPDAFQANGNAVNSRAVASCRSKTCGCKRSRCLKNYCECYEANRKCTSSCKCVDCNNHNSSVTGIRQDGRHPGSALSQTVIETVRTRLLARAKKAEQEGQSTAQAERVLLEEFGFCLSRIASTMFKSSTQ